MLADAHHLVLKPSCNAEIYHLSDAGWTIALQLDLLPFYEVIDGALRAREAHVAEAKGEAVEERLVLIHSILKVDVVHWHVQQ